MVDLHVRYMRAKLQNNAPNLGIIATVPGRGYHFLPTFTELAGRTECCG